MSINRRRYLYQFHKFQQNREQHFAPKIFTALRLQYTDFLKVYRSGEGHDALMHVSGAGLTMILRSLYKDSVHYGSLVFSQLPKASQRLKRRAPTGFNEEMISLINSYFEGEILNFSEGITDTTRDLIRVVLQIANEEGRSLDWIVENLHHESIDLTRNRSRLIARTESVTASNQAAYFAAAKTGFLMSKEWLSAADNRVRADHAEVNGHTVGFNDFFTVGGSRMFVPGARVQENGLETPAKEVCNCRCVALYEPQRNSRGQLIEWDYGIALPLLNSN